MHMMIILGLLIVFAVIVVLRPWQRRACRWREDRRALADGRVLHVCASCGAKLALPKGRHPKHCMAGEQQ